MHKKASLNLKLAAYHNKYNDLSEPRYFANSDIITQNTNQEVIFSNPTKKRSALEANYFRDKGTSFWSDIDNISNFISAWGCAMLILKLFSSSSSLNMKQFWQQVNSKYQVYVGQKIKPKINELTITPECIYWHLWPIWQSRALRSFTACSNCGMFQSRTEIKFPKMIRKC